MKSHVVFGVKFGHKEKKYSVCISLQRRSEILAPELYVSGRVPFAFPTALRYVLRGFQPCKVYFSEYIPLHTKAGRSL